jgi:hypothetical protein
MFQEEEIESITLIPNLAASPVVVISGAGFHQTYNMFSTTRLNLDCDINL